MMCLRSLPLLIPKANQVPVPYPQEEVREKLLKMGKRRPTHLTPQFYPKCKASQSPAPKIIHNPLIWPPPQEDGLLKKPRFNGYRGSRRHLLDTLDTQKAKSAILKGRRRKPPLHLLNPCLTAKKKHPERHPSLTARKRKIGERVKQTPPSILPA